MTEQPKVCAVCAVVLTRTHLGLWVHVQPQDVDHVPVPVERWQLPHVVVRCDFCNLDQAAWAVLSAGFELPGGTRQYSPDAWAACDLCGALIRRRRWIELVERVHQSLPPQHQDSPRSLLSELYQRLAENMTGMITRSEYETILRAQARSDTS